MIADFKSRLFFLLIVFILFTLEYLSFKLSQAYVILIACMLLVGIYVFYMILAKARYKERRTPFAKKFRPFVSIVIPAKNEAMVIGDTVSEMLKIIYHNSSGLPNYELIIVDDASTDDTWAILKKMKGDFPNLIIHHREPVPHPSKASVLNQITDNCRGEIIAVFDADAKISQDFLERIVPYLYDPKVGAVQAQKRISNADFNELTAAQEDEMIMLMSLGENQDLAEGAVDLRGNGMILKKAAIKDVGGWNEEALTEDLDMSTRLHLNNWDIRYCPDITVFEEGVTNLKNLLKQRKRWAEGGIRRYLDYLPKFFEAGVPLVKKLDLFAFFLSFYFPIWFFVGLLFSFTTSIFSGQIKIALVVYFFFLFSFLMSVNVFMGLYQSGEKKRSSMIYRTIRSVIFNAHWLVVIPIISFKLLFVWKKSRWDKTERQVKDSG